MELNKSSWTTCEN